MRRIPSTDSGRGSRRPAAQRAGILACAVALAACSGRAGPDGPHVLLVTVDSLRADHLGCYGYGRATSPRLDALAGESVLFERAYTHAPFTPPSHASLLTSLHVPSHGVLAWEESLPAHVKTMGQRFRRAGWSTGAFYNHPGLQRSRVTRGFDEVQLRYFEPAEATTEGFLEWVDGLRAGDGPFCAWVHLWDVHRPYAWRDWRPPYLADHVDREDLTFPFGEERFGPSTHRHVGRAESYYNLGPEDRGRERVIGGERRALTEDDLRFVVDRYDAGVWYADRALGRLVDALEERGLLQDTVLVITADHGESLTEREPCYFTHDPFLYEETLRVPLLVRLPGARHGGRRVESVARGVDVLPTLMELAGLERGADLQGASLVPALGGQAAAEGRWHFAQTQTRSAKETDARAPAGRWLEERYTVSDGRRKLIYDHTAGTIELYDLAADPEERRDLAADPERAAEVAELRGLLEGWREELGGAAPGALEEEALSPEMRALLEGIGYVDAPSEEPDPPAAGASG